jgi:malonyl-CoA/methylmalonyl-CoA synthetase
MVNPLASMLLRASREHPSRIFLRTPAGVTWTYRDLDAVSGRMAHALQRLGVSPGDRVAVQAQKSAELLALHVACARVGAVYLPLNPAYTGSEVAALLDDAEPSLVIRDDAHEDAAISGRWPVASLGTIGQALFGEDEPFEDVTRSLDDPAAILYTSGTTGRPKGAVLSHGNLVFSAETLSRAWGFTKDDVLLHMLPLFHTHGLFVAAHCMIASGSSMVLLDAFDPAAVIAELPESTVVMGVPTHYVRLLAEPAFDSEATRGVRLFTSGSAPMLVATHGEFQARTGQVILERYGMTETCMLTSNPLGGERRPGTVGLPLPGVDVRLSDGDPGGIEVRGPNVLAGYWRRPELRSTEFTDDGWFITGDLGRFHADGYLEIVGRSKDLIISGGLNVIPKEVEEVLDSLDGVLESAVVGRPDADFGEVVVAVVVGEPGVTVDPELLRLKARERLAGFKVPKQVLVVDELPRNALGKVEKARIREFVQSQ